MNKIVFLVKLGKKFQVYIMINIWLKFLYSEKLKRIKLLENGIVMIMEFTILVNLNKRFFGLV